MAKQQKPVYNDQGTHVHLFNPETGGHWECPVDVADTFVEHRGWVYCEPPDRSLEGLFDDTTAEGPVQTGFDPFEHDVDAVNEHLRKHAEDAPGEVERVLALEAAGKNRKTVVDPRPPADDPDETDPNPGD